MNCIKINDNEMLSIANHITETIDKYYSKHNIMCKHDDGLYTVHCEVTMTDTEKFGTIININTNIPFPMVGVSIREYNDNDETNLNFFDSNIVIELYRNEQTVALFNSAFSGYETLIIDFIDKVVDCYKNGGYDSNTDFIVK